MEAWANRGPEQGVITIDVHEDSPFRHEGYRRWSAWKMNYVRALDAVPGFSMVASREFPELGITVCVYHRDPVPVEFVAGWGVGEKWGRWALERRVSLRVRREVSTTGLRFRVAPFAGMKKPQVCRVLIDGREMGHFTVEGAPWRWQDHLVSLPPGDSATMDVVVEFSGVWAATEAGTRKRALLFKKVDTITGGG